MKKRYLYSLLFGIPGFFVSAMLSLVIFGAVIGILWLYVFGDNPWPFSPETALSILLVLVFLLLWMSFITTGYVIGKKLEKDPGLNWKHILISGGLTLLFILFIVLQQLSVGNLGPKSDSTRCSNFCSAKGYSASGMPPLNSGDRTCSCYDSSGHEALKTPLDLIDPGASK
ncbi:MAG TPA: hypothetical protein VK249_20640 [Anaerolineales bacterium]|nr:hypothetical protein [Anaerolineales bacterium]